MEVIFNDSDKMQILSAKIIEDGMLQIKTAYALKEEIKEKFKDAFACKILNIVDRGQVLQTYENYTEMIRIEEYGGKILGVAMSQVGKSTEERLSDMEGDMESVKQDVKDLQESGSAGVEDYAAVLAMAKMSAAAITDDEQALKVKDLYEEWSGKDIQYKIGTYLRYEEWLYKVLKDHTSQETWTPDTASSLYARVLTDPAGEILPWQQPDSTNPYKKGDKVTHNGKTWISTADGNVWEPGAVGAPWEEVEE